jgi:3-oxoacyl-[acyl-carrier-protein] synthase-1
VASAYRPHDRLRRVVVTGIGIVASIGNTPDRVTAALREGRSGVVAVPEYAQLGLRSQVAGLPDLSGLPAIDRKQRRFMGDGAIYAHHALRRAIDDADLTPDRISHPRTGLIVGSGAGSTLNHIEAIDIYRRQGPGKVPPYVVPRAMGNTVSACLATSFGIKGMSYGITSACATSAHSIGHGMELIAAGKQDRIFAGGAEEVSWTNTLMFDAMGALSTGYNATPMRASRPYDRGRDGFVIAGGAGVLVLEALEHARERNARIYAELVGYGVSSDGGDMVVPSQDGVERAMRLALENVGRVDYVNTHATATPVGDVLEVQAMCAVFGDALPRFSSTKGLTGHAIAAAGAHEAIYSLLMMRHGFIAGSANIEILDPALQGLPLVRNSTPAALDTVMSNSFGFGGTNASLIFRRFDS